ncbi:MAG: cytochrome c4 [Variovorax sp.]|nr:cytochrome c4 [Variovorax sp.]
MNKTLSTVLALAVASVTILCAPVASAQQSAGNAEAGRGKVAMCLGCHSIMGYRSSFPEVARVPKISGQGAEYLISALTAYKKGERKHPTMHSIAESLTDQDMADVAAYYAAQGLKDGAAKTLSQPDAKVGALLQKGACVSCHGQNLASPIAPNYPQLAGQHPDYLYVALKAYKTENNATIGRGNAVMGAIAKQFSNAEMKTLANYIGSLDGNLQTVPESRLHHASN